MNRYFIDGFVLCFWNLKEYIHDEEYLGDDKDDEYVGPKCFLQ